jgi:predicted amidophosphoribosyltransferase
MIARGLCICEKNIFELKDNIVIKKLDTIQQARVSDRTKRLRNLKGAFEIPNPSLLKGKTVIVIDDVITTGGTINEIIKAIKKSGAKKVSAFAVAH